MEFTMPGDIDEFTDAYSDDMHRLRDAWDVLTASPHLLRPITEAALCRILIVHVVGSLEGMMMLWKREWNGGVVLDAYLAEQPRRSNAKRVEDLKQALVVHGVDVEEDVLKDFLAIKLLRNRIVHSDVEQSNDSLAVIEARGFPRDVRQLRAPHWERVQDVNAKMMAYIAASTQRRWPTGS
jgi:hypothetical protein